MAPPPMTRLSNRAGCLAAANKMARVPTSRCYDMSPVDTEWSRNLMKKLPIASGAITFGTAFGVTETG